MMSVSQAPAELAAAIAEFWLEEHWDEAASIAFLESGWQAFAVNDTTTPGAGCGAPLGTVDEIPIVAERSVGYFQINACNFPAWEWQRLYNARHNAGTAHLLWDRAGQSWQPWFFSARALGLT